MDIFILAGTLAGVAANNATDMFVLTGTGITSGSSAFGFGLSTTKTHGRFGLYIATAATAGNLQVMAAQHTSGTNVTTVDAGSLLTLHRFA